MFIARAVQRSMLNNIRYFLRERIPDNKLTKKEKKLAYFKPIRPLGNFGDTLQIPGVSDAEITALWQSIRKQTQVVLSSENIGFVLFQFDRLGILTEQIFEILTPQLRRYTGEYPSRTIFGALYTSLRNNNKHYFDFFNKQLEASSMSFTPNECFMLAEALTKNQFLNAEEKLEYFTNNCAQSLAHFMQHEYREVDIRKTCNIIKELSNIGFYDERVWNPLFNRFWKQSGFRKVLAYENTIPYVEIFPLAAELAVQLRGQLERSPDIVWRYNIQEGRYYTNWEMIQKSQNNIKLVPEKASFFPSNDRKMINQRYLKLISQGSLKQQKQIQEDKARALGYAILNRYQKEDANDKDSIFEDQEYQQMFGMDVSEMNDFVQQMQKIEPASTQDKKKTEPKKEQKVDPKKQKAKKK